MKNKKKIVIDCSKVNSEKEFWDLYLKIVKPEGEQYFGKNLDAFWDALAAGGPGFPGNGVTEIELENMEKLKSIENGRFYDSLLSFSKDLKNEVRCGIDLIIN